MIQAPATAQEMTATMTTIATPAPTPSIPTMPAAPAIAHAPSGAYRQGLISAHIELGKARLNAMVVFTTALGFIVGTRLKSDAVLNWSQLIWT